MILSSCSTCVLTILLPCVIASGRTGINQATFSEFSWFTRDLRNPCSNNIQLNNHELMLVSRNLRSRIRSQRNNYFPECSSMSSIHLESLPQLYFDDYLVDHEDIYKQILLHSAHFRAMAHDWKLGQTCGSLRPNHKKLARYVILLN